MELTIKIETALITWNEVAGFCFSKDSNRYSRTKKREQAFVKHEIAGKIEIKNYFADRPVQVYYQWHTSGKFDLGNLAAGEKFIADSFNELQLWTDDGSTVRIIHDRITDTEDYVNVTISDDLNKKF